MTARPPAATRRSVLAGMMAIVATPALAGGPISVPRPPPRPTAPNGPTALASPPSTSTSPIAALERNMTALIDKAKLGGQVSVALVDPTDGHVIVGRAADLAQPPASVAKAATALYALDQLGPEYRFVTRLCATGPLRDGVITGDLVLEGGGDPELDTDGLAGLAQMLAAAGVRTITGRFVVSGGPLPEIAQIAQAQPVQAAYNPGVSGLNLNFNRVRLRWLRDQGTGQTASGAWKLALDARARHHGPEVRGITIRAEARSGPAWDYQRQANQENWSVAKTIFAAEGSVWLPVRAPRAYAGEVFQTLAASQGITLPHPQPVAGPLPPTARVLAHRDSRPLGVILREMLDHSTNLTAEVVGLTASGAPDLQASATAMAQHLGVAPGLVDHSGLGDASRISAKTMAALLARPAAMTGLAPLLDDFAIDMKARADRQPYAVRAKTGTLHFVSGLAGYLGRPGASSSLTFAILATDLPRRARTRTPDGSRPAGARAWAGRARQLQRELLMLWGKGLLG